MSFLRRLRHQFVMEGDNKKHGFFMVAEMLLIVIGITGALQLDNWNQNINDHKAEIILLEQLKVEFSQVEQVLEERSKYLEGIDSVLFKLYKSCGTEIKEYPNDDVLEWIVGGITPQHFSIYQGVLEDAINTGSLALVKNDSLRIELYSWKTGILFIQDYINTTNKDTDVFLREIYHKVSFRNYDNKYYPEVDLGVSEFKYNPNDLFNDMYFENITGVLYFRNKRLMSHLEENLISPLEKINALIESELAQTDHR